MRFRCVIGATLLAGVCGAALAVPSDYKNKTRSTAEPAPPPVVYAPPPPPAPPAPPPPPLPPLEGAAKRAVQIDGSISDEDYPPEAQRAGESGAALLKFFVDSSGNVTRCAIVESSGSLTLDDKSCKLVMARFRYAPALDKDGKPTSEWKTQRIRWQIPKPDPADEVEGLVPFSVDASYILQADGTVKDCKVVGAMPGKTPQADYCPTGNWHDPIKDAKGNPVTKRVHIKASLSITDVAPTPKRPARRRAGRRR